jgi:hypothetical protein
MYIPGNIQRIAAQLTIKGDASPLTVFLNIVLEHFSRRVQASHKGGQPDKVLKIMHKSFKTVLIDHPIIFRIEI